MGSPDSFMVAWHRLVEAWPAAEEYLMKSIFPDQEKWAWAWVGTRFLAGIRTTGRVEAEHKNYKLLGLSRTCTLNDLFDVLNARTDEQEDQDKLRRYKVSK